METREHKRVRTRRETILEYLRISNSMETREHRRVRTRRETILEYLLISN
jgi:hypothetical protein